jgi:hypothetical protein
MTIRNPIDQRHANPKDVACPIFWRRIGIPVSGFFAIYPWLVVLWDQVAPHIHRAVRGAPLQFPKTDFVPLKVNNVGFDLAYRAWHEWIYPYQAGQYLFIVGLAWFTLMLAAAMAGVVRRRWWIAFVLVAATGTAAVFLAQCMR